MLEVQDEVLLHGGTTNAGRVVRVGETVRRPYRPASPATHALLVHLERVGFEGAPRVLGVDDRGREVLSYLHGDAAIAPHEPWALTDEALVSVAQLLRGYHDAAASFDPAGHAWPRSVPHRFRDGLVSHNDPNLDNVIFAGGRAVAIIDFDLAGPGSRVWDVACAARLWAPLRDERSVPQRLGGRSLERLRLFIDAYGLSRRERGAVVEAAVQTHDWCYSVVRAAVARGHETFARTWQGGGRQRAERDRAWIAANAPRMRRAVAAGPPGA